MSNYIDEMLGGIFCQHCGEFIKGEPPGHPRSCKTCVGETDEWKTPAVCESCGGEPAGNYSGANTCCSDRIAELTIERDALARRLECAREAWFGGTIEEYHDNDAMKEALYGHDEAKGEG